MDNFRDAKPGKFHLNPLNDPLPSPQANPPFMRFAAKHGFAIDLWTDEGGPPESAVLGYGRLDWPVQSRPVMVPTRGGESTNARWYQALVRPDTEEIMSVVSRTYRFAENQWVASAVSSLSARLGALAPLVAAVGFGRTGERTLFVGRVTRDRDNALCLLAYNSHGGEGAVRFQLVEASRIHGTVYVLDTPHATWSVPHVGDVCERLKARTSDRLRETFVERYIAESESLWERLAESLWTPRHTAAMVGALWGKPAAARDSSKDGPDTRPPRDFLHPSSHLTITMRDVTDAGSAFRQLCYYVDNESDACERGDFTTDRDERLALGAGTKLKQQAWRWIVDNI